jgi:4-amino-4-deoxy-L-arabinose transferase-like glycosyltransferase
MTPIMHKTAVALLLVVGVQLWLLIGRGNYGSAPRPLVFIAAVALASLPFVYRPVASMLDRARHLNPKRRAIVGLIVFFIATALLYWTAAAQRRDLFPKMHDEHMHLLQAQMLARGKLWMPQHPVADSFESFHIHVKPVYASMVFPGATLFYVPAVWLKLPYAAMPLLVAGACAAVMYRVIAEVLDDDALGLLAALLLCSLTQFRYVSTIMTSHASMLLLGLAMMWAWLRWRREKRLGWAAVVGLCAGWAAITRPLDAMCYAAPIGVAMLWTMWRERIGARRASLILLSVVAAAAPFLVLQIVFNIGVTGTWRQTPYAHYLSLYSPQVTLGFRQVDPDVKPQTTLPQKLKYQQTYTLTATNLHHPARLWHTWTRERFPLMATYALPSELFVILIPVGLLGLIVPHGGGGRGARRVLFMTLPLFIVAYAMLAYLLMHYIVPITPGIFLCVLLAVHVITATFPKARPWLVSVLMTIVVLLSVRAFPQLNRLMRDDTLIFPTMRFNHDLPSMIQAPALVLYRFNPTTDNTDEEPVYNVDLAWPDDAAIVRAHDLSPEQNQRLLRYYADRQPERRVYIVERARVTESGYRPQYLGRVGDLAGPR